MELWYNGFSESESILQKSNVHPLYIQNSSIPALQYSKKING
jgi:hypothetical protein